jgi:tryptophan synthase alpha chain
MSAPVVHPPRGRLAAALRRKPGESPALVAFMTAGFPERAKFREHLAAVCANADAVEIGVPFSDPMAAGLTIQRSSHEALKQGVSLNWILAELAAMAPPSTPLLLMSYLNPLLAHGYEKLAREAAAVGVCGFIVPDLPLGEDGDFRAAIEPQGLALVQMVTPVTPAERMQRLCAASQGFVYAVTMTGTTGKSVAVPADVVEYLERVRVLSKVPVCAGFGIRSREQVQKLRGHVDGVIVGSALVEVLERGESPQAFLSALRS